MAHVPFGEPTDLSFHLFSQPGKTDDKQIRHFKGSQPFLTLRPSHPNRPNRFLRRDLSLPGPFGYFLQRQKNKGFSFKSFYLFDADIQDPPIGSFSIFSVSEIGHFYVDYEQA
jgi:hypothetical protein